MDINYRLNIFLMLLPLSNNWLLKKCVVIQRIIFDILTLTSNKKVMMWVAVWGFAVLIMRWISPVFSLFLTPPYTSLLPLPHHLVFPMWTPFHLLFLFLCTSFLSLHFFLLLPFWALSSTGLFFHPLCLLSLYFIPLYFLPLFTSLPYLSSEHFYPTEPLANQGVWVEYW